MADVTVNIRGDASQLRDELEDISGGSQSPSAGTSSSSSRMIEDVQREIQQRGVLLVPGSSSVSQIIGQYAQTRRESLDEDITNRYDARREDMRKRMSADYDAIDADIENKRQAQLKRLGDKADDPFYQSVLNQQLEQERQRRYRDVGQRYDEEEENINQEEQQERTQSQNDLTQAIRELTDYFNRQASQDGGAPDSFINNLRQQQQALIRERDAAETEEGAMDASRRLADVNERLRNVLSGGTAQQGKPYFDSMMQGSQGITNLLSGLQSGDIGGTMMGGAGAIAGLSGMGLKASLRFLGIAGIAAGLANWASGASDVSESLGGLAAFRSTTGGLQGIEARHQLGADLPRMSLGGKSYTDYGLSIEEFAEQARRRTSTRGMGENWYEETLRQIGMERSLALTEGSLERGGQYDRYGQNVTEAVSRLVTVLSGIEGSGVSTGDFTRVQEKYDIQQSLMASYMGRTDRPDYDVANRTLAAFSSVKGITQDARMGGDIEQFQNMIQNPINERMKALVYSSVADLFPETGGRMDLIDRALQNPENEGKIMQSVVKRITEQFGGTDTQMGYFAFKSLLPNISPDRRDAYIEAFTKSGAGNILSEGFANQEAMNKIGTRNVDIFAAQGSEYITDWTKFLRDIADNTKAIAGGITGTRSAPKINLPKSGGNR